jgi:hypothetical protein
MTSLTWRAIYGFQELIHVRISYLEETVIIFHDQDGLTVELSQGIRRHEGFLGQRRLQMDEGPPAFHCDWAEQNGQGFAVRSCLPTESF